MSKETNEQKEKKIQDIYKSYYECNPFENNSVNYEVNALQSINNHFWSFFGYEKNDCKAVNETYQKYQDLLKKAEEYHKNNLINN